jgi:hypothetical protein
MSALAFEIDGFMWRFISLHAKSNMAQQTGLGTRRKVRNCILISCAGTVLHNPANHIPSLY